MARPDFSTNPLSSVSRNMRHPGASAKGTQPVEPPSAPISPDQWRMTRTAADARYGADKVWFDVNEPRTEQEVQIASNFHIEQMSASEKALYRWALANLSGHPKEQALLNRLLATGFLSQNQCEKLHWFEPAFRAKSTKNLLGVLDDMARYSRTQHAIGTLNAGMGEFEKSSFSINDLARPGFSKLAQIEIKRNQPLVEASLRGLSAAQRQDYERLAELLSEAPALALQVLLLEGKLTQGTVNRDGESLLQALAGVVGAPLCENVSRQDLLAHLVLETAVPEAIVQTGKRTCTVTALEIYSARVHPAEYVRIVKGLASPDGTARLADGVVKREPGTDSLVDERSIPGRLWQPAFMELGNGDGEYDNAADISTYAISKRFPTPKIEIKESSGLVGEQLAELWRKVFGKKLAEVPLLVLRTPLMDLKELFSKLLPSAEASLPTDRLELVSHLKRHLQAGGCAGAGVFWSAGGSHQILITRFENGRFYFNNPQGSENSFSEEQLRDRLVHLMLIDKPDS